MIEVSVDFGGGAMKGGVFLRFVPLF